MKDINRIWEGQEDRKKAERRPKEGRKKADIAEADIVEGGNSLHL